MGAPCVLAARDVIKVIDFTFITSRPVENGTTSRVADTALDVSLPKYALQLVILVGATAGE